MSNVLADGRDISLKRRQPLVMCLGKASKRLKLGRSKQVKDKLVGLVISVCLLF